ncbi:MAG: hypothetical protein A3J76_01820 [Candidatus Moranbacteria bacterium RBG_13_45_13]|nr:MAG: hypothetical protein A3J76_01820 [Candidatus Moranbacteria bacterium RBG_13_45_13]
MEIRNGEDVYFVGKQVADAGVYRLYLCIQGETERQCLLQIASAVENNSGLDRAAYILGELKQRSEEIEEEYGRVKKDPKDLLNYHLGFPELVDSFICHQQGGRRMNILAFRHVEDASRMIPLTNITFKDRLRVDLRTSVWIMGKLLKLFVFTHGEGFSVGLATGNNILIEPDQHYVLFFDWSGAKIHSSVLPVEIRRQEISQAAQAVITVLGGKPETGAIPDDGDEAFGRYADFLHRLARGSESNAERAHFQFYQLVDSLWKRGYYPFTTKPLS